ncbi:hypothetical protein BT69DRAFT_1337386 [Atractiella rhizophila]|nr:hypothetical protein BT69DRAFT_1337386 [Atractiella rhizophila]
MYSQSQTPQPLRRAPATQATFHSQRQSRPLPLFSPNLSPAPFNPIDHSGEVGFPSHPTSAVRTVLPLTPQRENTAVHTLSTFDAAGENNDEKDENWHMQPAIEPFATAKDGNDVLAAPYDVKVGRKGKRFALKGDVEILQALTAVWELKPWEKVPNVKVDAQWDTWRKKMKLGAQWLTDRAIAKGAYFQSWFNRELQKVRESEKAAKKASVVEYEFTEIDEMLLTCSTLEKEHREESTRQTQEKKNVEAKKTANSQLMQDLAVSGKRKSPDGVQERKKTKRAKFVMIEDDIDLEEDDEKAGEEIEEGMQEMVKANDVKMAARWKSSGIKKDISELVEVGREAIQGLSRPVERNQGVATLLESLVEMSKGEAAERKADREFAERKFAEKKALRTREQDMQAARDREQGQNFMKMLELLAKKLD